MAKKNKEIEAKPAVAVDEKKLEAGPKVRQIVIETDGTSIKLVSAEVNGKIELIAILTNLVQWLSKSQ